MINVLHIGLSYKCNMKCKHCFVDKKKDKLTIDDYKKIIDILYERGLLNIIYTYGEPLLTDKLNIISQYCKEKGLRQTLMTNGYFINDKNVKMLMNNNVKNVMVSLDSLDYLIHDTNRGVKGSYEKAINSLKLLSKNKFNVGIACSIDDDNLKEIDNIISLARDLNITKISLLTKRINGKIVNLKNKDYFIRKFKENLAINNINIAYHDFRLCNIIDELYKSGLINVNEYEKLTSMNSCHRKHTISVAPNGDIFDCNLINNKIGNYFEDYFNDIIERKEENGKCINCHTEF